MLRRCMLFFLAVFIIVEWGVISQERHKWGIYSGDPFVKEIALTFDDGPREHGVQEIMQVLDSYDVKGTFFVVGKFAQRYGGITLALNKAGHEIENHTYTHPRLYRLWIEKIMREAERCDEVLEALNIRKTRFLRPPGGGYNLAIFHALRRMNLRLGLWSINTAYYTGRPADEIVRLTLSMAAPGAVVLMHSGVPNTVEALPAIIEALRERGYTLVTLNELWNGGRI